MTRGEVQCKFGPHSRSLDVYSSVFFVVVVLLLKAESQQNFTKATLLLDLVLQILEQFLYLFWVHSILIPQVLHW